MFAFSPCFPLFSAVSSTGRKQGLNRLETGFDPIFYSALLGSSWLLSCSIVYVGNLAQTAWKPGLNRVQTDHRFPLDFSESTCSWPFFSDFLPLIARTRFSGILEKIVSGFRRVSGYPCVPKKAPSLDNVLSRT